MVGSVPRKIGITNDDPTFGDGTGIAIAQLSAAFGDPSAIPDGRLFVYENEADSKVYLVVVVEGAYYITANMTAASA